jgi:hypothetical protein
LAHSLQRPFSQVTRAGIITAMVGTTITGTTVGTTIIPELLVGPWSPSLPLVVIKLETKCARFVGHF